MASAAVQLGLVLPPSEGKAAGGDGPTWSAGLGQFGELEARRAALVRKLARKGRLARHLLTTRGHPLDALRSWDDPRFDLLLTPIGG